MSCGTRDCDITQCDFCRLPYNGAIVLAWRTKRVRGTTGGKRNDDSPFRFINSPQSRYEVEGFCSPSKFIRVPQKSSSGTGFEM